jgi:hypothetical protein
MPRYNTLDIVSAAVAAFRINGNQIIRESETQTPNRKIVDELLTNGGATNDDVVNAVSIIEELKQRQTLAALTGKELGSFQLDIIVLLHKDTVPSKNIGILTWVPKLHADLLKQEDIQHQFAVLSFGSKAIGSKGATVEINFVVVTERYNKEFGCWRYYGHDTQGNLVGFLIKNRLTASSLKIKGRIKNLAVSKLTVGKTTYLNYVKEIK